MAGLTAIWHQFVDEGVLLQGVGRETSCLLVFIKISSIIKPEKILLLSPLIGGEITIPTLERIRETGRIRIGYGDTTPFSYRLPDGQVVGYSIEICNKLAEGLRQKLGLERLAIEYVYRTPRNRVQLLNEGFYDIECNASTNTSERRKSVAFTHSHFYATTRYVALARNNLRTMDDLRGRSVSVALGSINIGEINDLNREKVCIYPSSPQMGFKPPLIWWRMARCRHSPSMMAC